MSTLANDLRQRLWRWHFLMGLVVCPFMILLAITGSIYLFKAEIEAWEEGIINARSVYATNASSTGRRALSEDVLLDTLLDEYPGASLDRLTVAKENDHTVEFDIVPNDHFQKSNAHSHENAHHEPPDARKLTVWVDRYSGDILEVKVTEDRFFNIVKKLHSQLLLGDKASYIIELVASLALILLISGTVLWAHKTSTKRKKMELKPLKKIFSSKLKNNGRLNTRTAHGVLGIYITIPLLLMLLSGLPWTQLWGGAFKEINKFAGSTAPEQVWSVSLKSRDGEPVKLDKNKLSDVNQQSSLYKLDDVVRNPKLKELKHPIHILPPKPDNGVWTVRSLPQDRSKRQTLHFDQYSGRQLLRIGFEDYHPVQQIVSNGISLHEGALFGLTNKILVLFTALFAIGLSVLGLTTWWNRRRSGTMGVPVNSGQALPISWVWIIVGCSVFLPAAAISLVVVILLDYAWCKVRNRFSSVMSKELFSKANTDSYKKSAKLGP